MSLGFLYISLFLIYIRYGNIGEKYIIKRLERIVIKYVFWASVDLILLNRGNIINFIIANNTPDRIILAIMSNNTAFLFT